MPRYFFNVDYKDAMPDREGVDFTDDRAAWGQAVRACGEMMQELDGELEAGVEWRMDVTDADGRPLFAIHLNAERFIR